MTAVADTRRYVCPRCGEVAAAPGRCARHDEALADAEDDTLLGTDLGGYRIAETIGRGGMGLVYRAVQTAIDAEVAIKVLARELIGDHESSERFVNEARIANRVRHEGLVKVVFIGLLPDGRPYLIMEHLNGVPLSLLIGAELPLGSLLRRFAEAARAIGAMHDAGVIHRDLKPGNLFVTTAGFIKVLDFGIAKLADERSGLTRTGHTIGTPGYMSPQQAQAEPLDHRSDIYSLGVVLYEAVVGSRPFEGRVVEALVARDRPPALPDRVPRELDAIVQRAMAYEPGDRFATVRELADAVDAIAETLPPGTFGPLVDAPLAIATVPEPPTLAVEQPSTVQAKKPVSRLGRYVLEGTAGRGGEGVVLIGRDPKVQRKVALKLLAADSGDRRARVIAEAQAMARVNHPNVVTLYELGEDGDQLFLVMEYLEATDLERWLAERTRTWREIVPMFVAAGRGLEAAHAVGVVHRDFKPANVLLGKDGRPRVGDFGIAEIGGTTGDAAGTVAFMAPEQVEGGTVDARADQFAFCAALWHALHGEAPYTGDTAMAIAMAASRGELRDPAREVPSSITELLKRGLSAEPAQRFADMTMLLAALERAIAPARKVWPFAAAGLLGAAAIGFIVLREPAKPSRPVTAPPTLEAIRSLADPMDRLRALATLPLSDRASPEARMIARVAVVDGFVRKVTLDADPIADAASFSADGTLAVPVGDATVAIARDGTRRKLPGSPRAPRRVYLAATELRVLLDDAILATPLDAPAWKQLAHCDYTGMKGRRAEADRELTMLACIGSSSRVIVGGAPSAIEISFSDAVVFEGSRVVVRRDDAIEIFDPQLATPIARLPVKATQVAAAADLVAYVADGKAWLWDPATKPVTTSTAADQVQVIGGREPLVLAFAGATVTTLHAVRQPSLMFGDFDPARAVQASVAGGRIVESSQHQLVVRDHAAGRAWRQLGAPGTVISDARGAALAMFDGRSLRLWTIDDPPMTDMVGGRPARAQDHSMILTAVSWQSPLRAYDARGSLLDQISTPETRLRNIPDALLLARAGKTLRWTPATKQLVEVADRILREAVVHGDQIYAPEERGLVRLADGTVVCPGWLWRSSPAGIVLVSHDHKLLVCRLVDGRTIEIPLAFQLGANTNRGTARWGLSPDGARAAVIDGGKLFVFDTATGNQLALHASVAQKTALELAFAPTLDRIALVAEEGLFVIDGDQPPGQPGTAQPYKSATFVDDQTLAVLRSGRIVVEDLSTRRGYEIGMMAAPEDAKNNLYALDGHVMATSLYSATGIAVSYPLAPPEWGIVESWLARVRE